MSAMAALRRLEAKYVEKLAYYAEQKNLGNLTEDWGECSMICARLTLDDIRWEIENAECQGNDNTIRPSVGNESRDSEARDEPPR